MQDQQSVNQEHPQEQQTFQEQRLGWNDYQDIVDGALKEGNPICPYCD